MTDPKQASKNKSGQALGWLRQKSVPVVEVRKTGVQASCRSLKVGTWKRTLWGGACSKSEVPVLEVDKINIDSSALKIID